MFSNLPTKGGSTRASGIEADAVPKETPGLVALFKKHSDGLDLNEIKKKKQEEEAAKYVTKEEDGFEVVDRMDELKQSNTSVNPDSLPNETLLKPGSE